MERITSSAQTIVIAIKIDCSDYAKTLEVWIENN